MIINKVYHLADLHIRNLQRHKEYRLVFKKFLKQVLYSVQAVHNKQEIFYEKHLYTFSWKHPIPTNKISKYKKNN